MIKPIGLVIFDCDGVLVDIEPIAARVQVALGAELGWPLTQDEVVDRVIGRSPAAIHEQIAARLGPDTAAIWSQRFEQLHREAVDAELAPVDGLPEALDALTVPTCVASNGSHDKMRHTLRRTGLYERFAGRIYSATEVSRGKPAPDLFLHAAQQMGVDPEACVVVEDSQPGVHAAGMRTFGYASGLTPAERLEGYNTVVFHDMRQLPNLITERQPTLHQACPPTRFDNCSPQKDPLWVRFCVRADLVLRYAAPKTPATAPFQRSESSKGDGQSLPAAL